MMYLTPNQCTNDDDVVLTGDDAEACCFCEARQETSRNLHERNQVRKQSSLPFCLLLNRTLLRPTNLATPIPS